MGPALMMVHKCLFCCDVCWQVSVLGTCLHQLPNRMDTRTGPFQVWNTGIVSRLLTAKPAMFASKSILFFGDPTVHFQCTAHSL